MTPEELQNELIEQAEISVGVLGRSGQFVLVPLNADGIPFDDDATEQALAMGYGFCGVLAVVRGKCGARCAPDPDSQLTCLAAVCEFANLVRERLRPAVPQGSDDDFVKFAQALFELEDPRP